MERNGFSIIEVADDLLIFRDSGCASYQQKEPVLKNAAWRSFLSKDSNKQERMPYLGLIALVDLVHILNPIFCCHTPFENQLNIPQQTYHQKNNFKFRHHRTHKNRFVSQKNRRRSHLRNQQQPRYSSGSYKSRQK